ncbi:MAG: response regulator [Bacteroidia bacterium]
MRKTKILVVEDEVIVAKDIQRTLIKLGYDVPVTAQSAQSAFEKIDQVDPDLIFCDIKLKGEVDGIDIAKRLKEEYLIPVIFLTSYADKATLDRAKVTEPYGYILKPFNETDLQTTVEMALYKFAKDQEVRDNEQRYANALQNIDEALIITDLDDKINYVNPRAEEIFKAPAKEAVGKSLGSIAEITHADFEKIHAATEGLLQLNDASVKSIATGESYKALVTVSQIKDEINNLIGRAILIKSNANVAAAAAKPAVEGQAQPAAEDSVIESMIFHDSFFVKKGSLLVKVYLSNIHWIQAMDNYVVIQTSNDQFVVHSTMRDIEAKLPPDRFGRVHRSYIVQYDKIGMLEENTIVINEKIIPVGKSYKEQFMNRLNFL